MPVRASPTRWHRTRHSRTRSCVRGESVGTLAWGSIAVYPRRRIDLRPLSLASLCLALVAGALLLAGPVSAQGLSPHPCQAFTPCSTVVGPWVTAPSDEDLVYQLSCPDNEFAVASDAVFPGAIYPVGVLTGGASGYDGGVLTFGVFPVPVSVTYKPAVGCSPFGAKLSSVRKPAGNTSRYRTLVRTIRVRPRVVERVRLSCGPGERLIHSGSAVAFFTRRPPSSGVIKSLVHRHRRIGSAAEAVVVAPRGVGDNERVELQLTALCAPAPQRKGAVLGAPQGKGVVLGSTPAEPCLAFTPCTPVIGPWVTTPSDGDSEYDLDCPAGMRAVDSDAAFPYAIYPVGVLTGGGLVPGVVHGMAFGVFPVPVSVTYQPGIGCSPIGATLSFAQGAAATSGRYRTVVRTVRVRPGVIERVRVGCRSSERLVHAGSAVAFFTRRPPSPDVVKALVHRHRHLGSAIEAIVVAPRGVGNNERVELQVTAVCARAG